LSDQPSRRCGRLEDVSKRIAVALLVTFPLILTAACGGSSSPAHQQGVAEAKCPPRGLHPGWLGGGPDPSVLVPSGAVSLVDCQFNGITVHHGKKVVVADPHPGPEIRNAYAIGGYVAMLEQQPAASSKCWNQAVRSDDGGASGSDLLLFGYPDGRTWVLDPGGRCDGVAGPAGIGIRATGPTQEILVGLQPNGSFGSTHPAPSLVGLSLRAAVHRDPELMVVGEIVERATTGMTVAVVGTLAAVPVDTNEINVIVALPPAPTCRAAQLRGTVDGGEPGAGTAFASLVLRDVGRETCTLRGPIKLSAVDGHGDVLAVQAVGVQGTGRSPLVLSPVPEGRGRRVESSLASRALLSSTDFAGNCSRSETPSGWRVTLPSGGRPAVVDHDADYSPPVIFCGAIDSGPFTEPGRFVQ
jgi:hypothetical protein